MCSEHGLLITEIFMMDREQLSMKSPCNGHDLTWTEEEEESFNNMDALPDVEIEYQQRLEDDECEDGACKI